MNDPIRLIIHGAAGRMGQALLRIAAQRRDVSVVAAIVRKGSELDQKRIIVEGQVDAGVPLHYRSGVLQECTADVVIDFSGAEAFDAALDFALQRKLAFVSGSTGLSPVQLAALDRAAASIPVLWAANFSLGVAALAHLASKAAALLPQWDCEIVEAHHARKLDAPSGTALMLGREVAHARGIAQEKIAADRSGTRQAGEIGYAVIRGGDIVGEHDILFIGEGERIALSHRATHRDIFARGAIAAACWIVHRESGRHAIADVLGL